MVGIAFQGEQEVIGKSGAAVVVGDDLDDGDVGLLVIVGEGAGLALTEGDGDVSPFTSQSPVKPSKV